MLRRRLFGMLHLPGRRETGKTLGAGFLIAIVCWYFGVDVWHAILLACAITVIGVALLVGSSAPEARDPSWRPERRAGREGSRRDIAELASSLGGRWRLVGVTAARRLEQIARRRLALDGLDLSSAEHRTAIERRIGSRAYAALVRPRGRAPSLRALLHCLDMLDLIDSAHYPPPQPRARRRDLRAIPFSLGRARER